jgi:pimeloyl-ACP methyl ester carboxylesterase/DNA-binding CsgD family transcriptional regulator
MVAGGTPAQRQSRDGSDQEVRFCIGQDDARLAWAVHGSGPPLIVVSCWLSHLQYDWRSLVWRHFLEQLGGFSTLVRYDERGFGMSDWAVTDFSLDARYADLEAVVQAAGFERFALLGMSGGAPVAMTYAARHPERVTRLVLYGGSCGRPPNLAGDELAEEETFRSMIKVGWAKEDPLFRRVFTRMFIPDASEEQMRWFDDLQRLSTSTDNALASRIGRQSADVADDLSAISAPTLILHAIRDRTIAFAEAVEVAGRIPDARLVELDSANHILLQDEPAWETFVEEVRDFLEPDRAADGGVASTMIETLSPRELDVLRLVAHGRTNAEVAAELGLSPRTVERHLSNVYAKMGVTGSAARAAVVADAIRRGLV